jgi:hypothetical protein
MTSDPDVQRVVIEPHRSEGPMSGRFLAEGQHQQQPFSGWFQLLALLETARSPAAQTPKPTQEGNR